MKEHSRFQTTVDFTTTKNEYDRDSSRDRRMNIMEWLYNNVGPSANVDLSSYPPHYGIWDSVLNYSEDGRSIIQTYSFKNSKDATMFALKWS